MEIDKNGDKIDQAFEMLEKGSVEQGEAILKDLLEEHPGDCNILFGMGIVHATRKQYDEAIEYFKKAIEISPDYMEAYFNIGVAYKEKLDIYNMLRAFQKVVLLGNPRDPVVQDANRILAGWNQYLLKTDKTTIGGYLRGYELFNMAFAEMELQQWRKAIKYFKKVLALSANHYQSYGNMGICYAKIGLKQKALQALDQAIQLNPHYELAIANKTIIGKLKEGEVLEGGRVASVDYAKEYTLKNKSYISERQSEYKRS